MPKDTTPGKPTTRPTARMRRPLQSDGQAFVPSSHNPPSLRSWVRQADIDEGHVPGVSTSDAARMKELEQENRELKRANEILKRAASFFGAELDRQHKK